MQTKTKQEKPLTKEELAKKKKDEKKAVVAAVITSVVLLGVITFLVLKIFFPEVFTAAGREIEVPNFVGQNIQEVEESINKKDFKLTIEEEESTEYEEGIVISQDPGAKDVVRTPAELTLVVSAGAKDVTVPNVLNKEYQTAEAELSSLGLKYKEVFQYDDKPNGYVINQMPPANSSAKAGDEVTLFISRGKEVKRVEVPQLVGLEQSQAKRDLLSANLTVGNITTEASDKAAGTVIFQSVQAGSMVEEKSEVNLIVSSGPKTGTRYIKVDLPQDKDSVVLRVLKNGTEVYNATHKKEEGSVDVKVSGSGSAKIDIYLDGVLTKSETVDFNSQN